MKDTIITPKRKKTELLTLLACFLIANALNLYAILAYGAPFSEMITCMGYVLVFACVLYGAWTLLRLLLYALARIVSRKR